MLSFTLFPLILGVLASASDIYVPVIGRPKAANFSEVLDKVSGAFLGKPYQLGPLGEGPGALEDSDPLYRLDAFDCTTFIETVMANAYCFKAGKDMSECLADRMQKIRYGGARVTFRERNHIPELDWLPHNVARGYLEDLHTFLFPGEWHTALIKIDRELWLSNHMKIKAPEKGRKPEDGPGSLAYLPVAYFFSTAAIEGKAKLALEEKLTWAQKDISEKLSTPGISKEQVEELLRKKFRAELDFLKATFVPLEGRLSKIPSGTVLNLIRSAVKDPAKAKLTTIVSHQGLVIQMADGAHIRQAAPGSGHVGDQRLGAYLLRYVRSANYRGVSLYRILPEK